MLSDEPVDIGPLFIKALKDAGKIATQTFSFSQRGYAGD
jgi:hypothetical protein